MYFNLIIISINIVLYFIIMSSRRISVKKKNNLFLVISFFIIGFLMATRTYSTGTDTEMYVRVFNRFSQLKWESSIIGNYYEPLYIVLNILLSYISNNPRILIVATSVFISFSFYIFIRNNSKDSLISVIMFICLLFIYGAMNTIRQYIAMSIILLGFSFVKKKKILPYIITVIIAYLFHSSALVGIIIYPMYNMKYSHTRVILIFATALLANIFVSGLINNIYNIIGRTNYYSYRVGQENIANLIYMIVYFAMYIFSLFEMKKSKKTNMHSGFYLYTFVMSSAFSLIAMNLNVLARATTYFNIFSIVCLPNVISENIHTEKNRVLVNLIIIMIFVLYSSIIIKFRPEWNTAFNYKNCIFSTEQSTFYNN